MVAMAAWIILDPNCKSRDTFISTGASMWNQYNLHQDLSFKLSRLKSRSASSIGASPWHSSSCFMKVWSNWLFVCHTCSAASKGQSLRQSHHPTLPEIYQILATKRSYTVTLWGSLPASLLQRHSQDAHHPNLWLLRFQICFSQFLASCFNHDKSQRGKVRLWVSSSIALILNLLTRSGVPTSALEESVLLKVFPSW